MLLGSREKGALLVSALVALAAACAPTSPGEERIGRAPSPLAISAIKPLAQVYVANAGALDVEGTYLPQVVCCENGAAPPGALEAQAVMARTYMYFRNASDGLGTQAKPFTGTTSDQAYHCATQVTQACKDAVVATKDQITAYTNASGAVIANASFFVDGPRPACLANKACTCAMPAPTVNMTPADHPQACDCFTDSSQGAANPAYVTYNWAESGAAVKGSTIGSTTNESNRGCASQNIQACLAYAGWSYADQLRFFYGQDIALFHPDGTPVDLTGTPDASSPPPADDAGDASTTGIGARPSGDSSGCSVAGARRGGSRGAVLALVLTLVACARRRRPMAVTQWSVEGDSSSSTGWTSVRTSGRSASRRIASAASTSISRGGAR
jgi:hypothetical protein